MTSTLASVMGTYGWGLGWGVNYSDSDAERYINVAASYELTVQFGFCGSLAGDMAHSFTQRVNNNPISLEAFKAEKLSVMRKSPIRRAPQKRETRWVEYFNQDVIFSYIVNTQQPIDWVEGVVIADETSEIPVIIKIPESIVYP
ncbi:hypothetical protein D9M71_453840 [compost metagenome]